LILRLDDRNATASIAVSDLSSPDSLARAEQDIFAFTDTVGSETTVALVGNKADLAGDVGLHHPIEGMHCVWTERSTSGMLQCSLGLIEYCL
jgi:hypothetical protein